MPFYRFLEQRSDFIWVKVLNITTNDNMCKDFLYGCIQRQLRYDTDRPSVIADSIFGEKKTNITKRMKRVNRIQKKSITEVEWKIRMLIYIMYIRNWSIVCVSHSHLHSRAMKNGQNTEHNICVGHKFIVCSNPTASTCQCVICTTSTVLLFW